MLNTNDLKHRNVIFVDAIENPYKLKVSQGNLVLENEEGEILTRLNRQKVFAIFVMGRISLTLVMLDYCQKNAIALVVMNRNFRQILYHQPSAEANFLLRQHQFQVKANPSIGNSISHHLIRNKIQNQCDNLQRIRIKSERQKAAITSLKELNLRLQAQLSREQLMGIEGNAAKIYFAAFFEDHEWKGRSPRIKTDPLNVTLDMGYTHLFNYIEGFIRLFGFDLYIGVLHQTWFKRKSLVCDLIEPFRALIDYQVRKSFNLGQFSEDHFISKKEQYSLHPQYIKHYSQTFFEILVKNKMECFTYIREYYRAFMRNKSIDHFPIITLDALLSEKLEESCES